MEKEGNGEETVVVNDDTKRRISPEERMEATVIKPLERDRLNKVYDYISRQDKEGKEKWFKEEQKKSKMGYVKFDKRDKIVEGDLQKVLEKLGLSSKKAEIKEMIWEVDDDMDGCISKAEFIKTYKRCVNDKEFMEPRQLYNLIQFLMFDSNFKGTISEEETLQLLYIRHGRDPLDNCIREIFGEDGTKNQDGEEKQITYLEYMDRANENALAVHIRKTNEIKQKAKNQKVPLNSKELNTQNSKHWFKKQLD